MGETEAGGYWSRKLEQLGLELPTVVPPVANYAPAVRTGAYVYTSGQLPVIDGALPATGKVGAEVTPERAAELARACAVAGLDMAIDTVVGGVELAVHEPLGDGSVGPVEDLGPFVGPVEAPGLLVPERQAVLGCAGVLVRSDVGLGGELGGRGEGLVGIVSGHERLPLGE